MRKPFFLLCFLLLGFLTVPAAHAQVIFGQPVKWAYGPKQWSEPLIGTLPLPSPDGAQPTPVTVTCRTRLVRQAGALSYYQFEFKNPTKHGLAFVMSNGTAKQKVILRPGLTQLTQLALRQSEEQATWSLVFDEIQPL